MEVYVRREVVAKAIALKSGVVVAERVIVERYWLLECIRIVKRTCATRAKQRLWMIFSMVSIVLL